MRILVQRVAKASFAVEGRVIGAISRGLLLLFGIGTSDGEAELEWMANKCASLRIFSDEAGKMNKSVLDIGGEILAVSQFTLYGDASGGNRPGFTNAARPEVAQPLFDKFVAKLTQKLGKHVPTGQFGADMQVELINDGPVTIWLEK